MSNEEQRNRDMNAKQKAMLQNIPGRIDLQSLITPNTELITKNNYKKIYKIDLPDTSYVIKSVSSKYTEYGDFNETINEAFVGIFGINSLNSKNFSKVVQYNLDSTCLLELNNPICHYVAYETIPGITLDKYIQDRHGNRDILVNIIQQIIAALYQAHSQIDFVHYDLHLNNIIITPDNVPVIIDYGRSHIQYKGNDYGMELADICVSNTGNWQVDIIYLLSFLILVLCPSRAITKYISEPILKDIEAHALIQFLFDTNNKMVHELHFLRANGCKDRNIQNLQTIQESIAGYWEQETQREKDDILIYKGAIEYYRGDYYENMNFLVDLLAFFPNFQDIMNEYGEMFLLGTEFIPKQIACFGKQEPRSFTDFNNLVVMLAE